MLTLHRLVGILSLVLALLGGQHAALAHDVSHFDAGAPSSIDCDTHYHASQMGGGPLAAPLTVFLDAAASPRTSSVRQRDASIPARLAYRAQAPPATPA